MEEYAEPTRAHMYTFEDPSLLNIMINDFRSRRTIAKQRRNKLRTFCCFYHSRYIPTHVNEIYNETLQRRDHGWTSIPRTFTYRIIASRTPNLPVKIIKVKLLGDCKHGNFAAKSEQFVFCIPLTQNIFFCCMEHGINLISSSISP